MCQTAAHIQQGELPAGRQILTKLPIELNLGYDGSYVNSHANERRQSLFPCRRTSIG